MPRKVFTIRTAFVALIILSAASAFSQDLGHHSSPLDNLDHNDAPLAETGLILFDQALERFWSSTGSPEGTMGLLSRSSRVHAYVSDPAARYYLMARVELYRGRVTLESDRRSRARPHFERAMEFAAESASFRDSAEAHRVKAEAGYGWMLTRYLRGELKMGPRIGEWTARSLELDPGNPLSIIVHAQLTHRVDKKDEERLLEVVRMLEELEDREDLDDIARFRSRILLSKINEELNHRSRAEYWCGQAAGIFPQNPEIQSCR